MTAAPTNTPRSSGADSRREPVSGADEKELGSMRPIEPDLLGSHVVLLSKPEADDPSGCDGCHSCREVIPVEDRHPFRSETPDHLGLLALHGLSSSEGAAVLTADRSDDDNVRPQHAGICAHLSRP